MSDEKKHIHSPSEHHESHENEHHHHQPPVEHHHHQPPLEHHHQPPPQYGTFQGIPHHSPQPAMGFPQPVPPHGATAHPPQYYAHGYQAVPGYAVAEGTPVRQLRQPRLPCCGIGMGWVLFFTGFLFVAIPWYVAVFILVCAKIDSREKPAYVACTIAAILAAIVLLFGLNYND